MFWDLLPPMEIVALETQCSEFHNDIANRTSALGQCYCLPRPLRRLYSHCFRPGQEHFGFLRSTQSPEKGSFLTQVHGAYLTLAIRQRVHSISVCSLSHQSVKESTSRY
jgi:hypothetical protein